MTACTLRYFVVGDLGELVHHKEEYPTRISGLINYWFACRDKRKYNVTLELKQNG